MEDHLGDLGVVALWGLFFIVFWSILWGLVYLAVLWYRRVSGDEILRGRYALLSNSPGCTTEELPFAVYHIADQYTAERSPTPSISLIMPSRSSDLQQLYIALQARQETDAAEKQARDAADERASLGSIKSLKVPMRMMTPPSRRA
ncbi:hypothetical protein K439DRAFT_262330 [Ramaria rubella]|nr:hypothetical protein K439DRAFT_262330 [Ramaria rubella]